MNEPQTGEPAADEAGATLTDEEIETRPLGSVTASLDDDSDTGDDSGDDSDTGDDAGDEADPGDAADEGDTGDDSGDDSGDSGA